jgi:lipopolysaccharide transport system ATP-binding protein
MGEVVIRAEGLGKRYRIGRREAPYKTLRESLSGLALAPIRRLQALSSGGAPPEEETIWALREVDIEVRCGEVLGIVGRNGAGKSTLLKVLARITEPTTGRVELRGRVGSLLEVGTGFHPELTGRENIYLNGAILGMRKAEIEGRFDEIVAFAEIERFLDTPVKRYSSGMYVRLAFAVAAHMESEILLIDEVLAVGDAAFQKKCIGAIGRAVGEGRTALFVSHNMMMVQQLCGTGVVLDRGRVELCAPIAEVVDRYLEMSASAITSQRDTRDMVRRPGEGTRFRFTRVALEEQGTATYMWDPLSVMIEYECLQDVEGVVVGLSVMRLDGTAVFSAESEDDGLALDLGEGESGTLAVTIPAPNLAPARYALRVGARSGGRVIDWLDNLLTFDVEQRDGSLIAAQAHLGMRPRSSWQGAPSHAAGLRPEHSAGKP